MADILSAVAGAWVTGSLLFSSRKAAAAPLDTCEGECDASEMTGPVKYGGPPGPALKYGVKPPVGTKYGGPPTTKYGVKPPSGTKYGGPPALKYGIKPTPGKK